MIASETVIADDVTDAWLGYIDLVSGQRSHELFHTVVRVVDPIAESPAGRRALEEFFREWAEEDPKVYPISTVRTTIFPKHYAQRARDSEELAASYRADYDKIRRSNRRNMYGTYFGRLVDIQVSNDGAHYDQLNDTIRKLRARNRNATMTEIDLRFETDEDAPALTVYETERNHARSMGFPCMSHLSFQRDRDTLHVAAFYRNQDVGRKAYGNMLGLGQLCEYVAAQSGLKRGSLSLMAGRAYLGAPAALLKRHLPLVKAAVADG